MTLQSLGREHPVAQGPLFFGQSGFDVKLLADAARHSGDVGDWVAMHVGTQQGLVLEAAQVFRAPGRINRTQLNASA